MRKLTLIALLAISLTAQAQTSKDSLVLKMHRREWTANLDTLSSLIPAIGRSKSADDADRLQNWMISVLNRMAWRLDTIPVIKKPK